MADVTQGDHERFVDVKQAVYIHDNVYVGFALPMVLVLGILPLAPAFAGRRG